MKKYFLSFLLVLGCLLITGCKGQNKEMYHNFNRVASYLYEVDYDDYVVDTEGKTLSNIENFACSSVKNGNYYGRNFDFIFNDVPEFIIKVAKKDDRKAFMGVGLMSSIHESNDLETKYKEELELLPNTLVDGINSEGVICSINVVSREDTVDVTGTNPDGEKMHMSLLVPYILSYSNSADHAIELINELNIYGDVGEMYNLHFMIADKDKTYIVEFIDNKVVAKEKKDNEQIMTNFYSNLDELTEHADGVERYNILKENYKDGNSFEGMWKLLQKVRYSNAYLFETDNRWLTEFLTQSEIKSYNSDINYKKTVDEKLNIFFKSYWTNIVQNNRVPSDSSVWFTTHNSTFDIENKTLRVTVQEDYNNYYEYTLDK